MQKKLISLFTILLLAILLIGCNGTLTTNTTVESTTEESTTEGTTTEGTTTEVSTTEQTTSETTLSTTTESFDFIGIEITNQSKTFYRLNEEFDKSSIELTAYLNNDTSQIIETDFFGIRGFNSASAGEKTIFVTFDNYVAETKIIVLEDYAFEIDMPYYQNALNLKGDILHVTLNNIINEGFNPLLYGDARYILDESDMDPNNSNNVMLVYTGNSVDSTWDSGATWNREHVWPQSRLGVYVKYGDADFASKATDIHNLKPADPDENSFRSNDYFDYFNTNDTYEPRDEVKGDIARIIFYMATMYFDLTLNDDPLTSSAYKTMGILSVLLEWNELDPVDEFEMNRNNILYSYQGNRNPFIDYPEFAELIWGDLA